MTARNEKVLVLTLEEEDSWGMPLLAYDVQILAEDAACLDYLQALDAFAEQALSDCRGCDGCCHERAPVTAWDMPGLCSLVPPAPFPFHQAVQAFCRLEIGKEGWGDITLARPEGHCIFLDLEQKICRSHGQRPLACRSHYCIPQSQRAADLRSALINKGEDLLLSLLLAEEEAGAPPLLMPKLKKEDYPPPPASLPPAYDGIRLKEICSPQLWEELKKTP